MADEVAATPTVGIRGAMARRTVAHLALGALFVAVVLALTSCGEVKRAFVLTEVDYSSRMVQNVPSQATKYYWWGNPKLPLTVHFEHSRCSGNPSFGCGASSGILLDESTPGPGRAIGPFRGNPIVFVDSGCYGNYGPTSPPEKLMYDRYLVDADGNRTPPVPTITFCYYSATPASIVRANAAPPEPAIPLTLRSPTEISLAPVDLARSAGLTLALVTLVAFPAQLFNSTMQAHYDEVVGWFRFLRRLRRKREPTRSAGRATRASPPTVAALTIFAAVLAAFLNPAFGANTAGLETVLANALAIGLTTLIVTGITALAMARLHRLSGGFRVYRGGIVVAVACVVLSRLVGAQPGYMYGVILGYDSEGAAALPRHHKGRLTGIAYTVLLVASFVVWILWIPVKPAAITAITQDPNAPTTVLLVTVSATFSTFFVAGIGSMLFSLLPLRYLDGEKLLSWRRVLWAALFGLGAFLYVHVVLSSAADTPNPAASYGTTIALFVLFGALSTAFWGYFRFRPERTHSSTATLGTA